MQITVGELIERLKIEDPNLPVSFGGLDFYRVKGRGTEIQIEFAQNVWKEKDGNVYVQNFKPSNEPYIAPLPGE